MRVANYAVVQHGEWEQSEPRQVRPVTRLPVSSNTRHQVSPVQKTLYALVTMTILVGLVQGVRCGIVSALKLEGLTRQLSAVQQFHAEAQLENASLKDKLSLYSSPLGMEELAREKLDMVRSDEILVRVYPQSVAQAE